MLLQNVALKPHPHALIGALGGLLTAAGRDLDTPYLMGATGHAFRLTLDLVLSPSGPMELNFHQIFPLWENLGAWFKRVTARPGEEGYESLRAEMVERVRGAVAAGHPAIVYGLLGQAEYGLVVGVEDDRWACLTPDHPDDPDHPNQQQGPAWMEVAAWPAAENPALSRAEMITLLDVAPSFDRRRAEVASLRFAVDHFWEPPSRDMWLQHGQQAYQFWQASLVSPLPLHGPDPVEGHRYNLLLLQRTRRDAAAYLKELADRYPEAPTLVRAAAAYKRVADLLAEGVALLPVPGATGEGWRKPLADLLGRALQAEREGVEEIERAMRPLR